MTPEAVSVPDEIIQAFFKAPPVAVTPLGEGLVNRTVLVTDVSGHHSVLQKLSPIFEPAALVADYQIVSEHLRGKGWQIPKLIPTRTDQLAATDGEGNAWRRLSFIASDPVDVPTLKTASPFQAGQLLGKLHRDLATLDYTPTFAIPNFHDTTFYAEKLADLQARLPDATTRKLATALLGSYQVLPPLPDDAPQLIHGDPQYTNMLFKANTPFTFIDFDTLMQGAVWLDIGDLLRSQAEGAAAAGRSPSPAKLQSIVEGYRQTARPNESPEAFLDTSMLAMKRIALELAMRFMIDIVEDSYFAWDKKRFTSRSDHNLARAKTQWRIAQINPKGVTL